MLSLTDTALALNSNIEIKNCLELKSLAFERDDRVLFSNVNAYLESGDIFQVEGPNGSGKTTLLRMITTALMPMSGEITWRGSSVSNASPDFLSALLFLGHQPGLKQSLSPEENLVWWRRLNTNHNRFTNIEALARMGLRGYESIPCINLSAGQQRRAALARLLITEAPLWVLDEPFTAIDQQGVCELEALIMAHAQGGGIVIFSSHQTLSLANIKRLSLAVAAPDLTGAV